jgi:hypothetical protein
MAIKYTNSVPPRTLSKYTHIENFGTQTYKQSGNPDGKSHVAIHKPMIKKLSGRLAYHVTMSRKNCLDICMKQGRYSYVCSTVCCVTKLVDYCTCVLNKSNASATAVMYICREVLYKVHTLRHHRGPRFSKYFSHLLKIIKIVS